MGALFTPGTTVPERPACIVRPSPAASQRQSPYTPVLLPSSGACYNEASSRVHWRSPARSSPRLPPRMGGERFGFSPSFTPRRHRQRMSRWGQVMGTNLSYVTVTRRPSSLRSHSSRATSWRTYTLALEMRPGPGAGCWCGWWNRLTVVAYGSGPVHVGFALSVAALERGLAQRLRLQSETSD
jgi:hypothetical protein